MANSELVLGQAQTEINNAGILLPDSAYIRPTLTTGTDFTNWGGFTYYYKIGTRVYINISVSELTSMSSNEIFTLPVGYRPRCSTVTVLGYLASSADRVTYVSIATNGKIVCTPNSTTYAIGIVEFDAYQ